MPLPQKLRMNISLDSSIDETILGITYSSPVRGCDLKQNAYIDLSGEHALFAVFIQMYISSDSDLTKWNEKIGDGKTCWPGTGCIFNAAHGRVLGILHCRFECFMTSYTVESIIVGFAHPAIWEHCTDVDARLGQRLRRWTSLASTSVEGLASLSKPGDPLAGTGVTGVIWPLAWAGSSPEQHSVLWVRRE